MKRFLLLLTVFFCIPSLAHYQKYPIASPPNSKDFCVSFKEAAEYRCRSAGMLSFLCQDMKFIYSSMIGFYGSTKKACQVQKDTTFQICMDSWKCYREGGKDSQNRLCSSTGKACQ